MQPLETIGNIHHGTPPRCFPELARIGHIEALVSRTPVFEAHVWLTAFQRSDVAKQIQQTHCAIRAATNIEHLPCQTRQIFASQAEGTNEVLNKQSISHLLSVAINAQRSPFPCPDKEVCDPSLVFGAELMRPINTAHAKHDGGQSKGAGMVQHILI